MVFIYAITWILQRQIFHLQPNEAAIQSLTVSFSNNVAVGLPLLLSMFGPEGTVAVAAGIGVGSIVISPVTLVVLESGTEKAQSMPVRTRLLYAVLQSCKRPDHVGSAFGDGIFTDWRSHSRYCGAHAQSDWSMHCGRCTVSDRFNTIRAAVPAGWQRDTERDSKEYRTGRADVRFRSLTSRSCAGSASRDAVSCHTCGLLWHGVRSQIRCGFGRGEFDVNCEHAFQHRYAFTCDLFDSGHVTPTVGILQRHFAGAQGQRQHGADQA